MRVNLKKEFALMNKFFSLRLDPFWTSCGIQGPVVQNIVSLTSLSRDQLVKFSLTLLPNILIIFVEKM